MSWMNSGGGTPFGAPNGFPQSNGNGAANPFQSLQQQNQTQNQTPAFGAPTASPSSFGQSSFGQVQPAAPASNPFSRPNNNTTTQSTGGFAFSAPSTAFLNTTHFVNGPQTQPENSQPAQISAFGQNKAFSQVNHFQQPKLAGGNNKKQPGGGTGGSKQAKQRKQKAASPAPAQNYAKSISSFVHNAQVQSSQQQNPAALGFANNARDNSHARTKPWMIPNPHILDPIVVQAHPWDLQNQQEVQQIEATGNGDQEQYETLQQMRGVERTKMESLNLVDSPDKRRALSEAISFVGSCQQMCPAFERVRRRFENNVKAYEKDSNGVVTPDRAVKAFSRPAAGQPPPLPSDVRPPNILVNTLNYLVNEIVPQLPGAHPFLWDRTRSIRQDFTYQNYSGPEAVWCNEQIVRIHIYCLHFMSGHEYSKQQELEQLNKALQSLMEMYKAHRARDPHSECLKNEAEFHAYHLLSHLREADVVRQIQSLPRHVFDNQHVQDALYLREIIQQGNLVGGGRRQGVGMHMEDCQALYAQFFDALKLPRFSFLVTCMLESHFTQVRLSALRTMSRAFHSKGRPYSLEQLSQVLGFDDAAQAQEFFVHYKLTVTNGAVDVPSFNETTVAGLTPFADICHEWVTQKGGDLRGVFGPPGTASATFQAPLAPSKPPSVPFMAPVKPRVVQAAAPVAPTKPQVSAEEKKRWTQQITSKLIVDVASTLSKQICTATITQIEQQKLAQQRRLEEQQRLAEQKRLEEQRRLELQRHAQLEAERRQREQQAREERARLISTLSEEIYRAFVRENTYFVVLDSFAAVNSRRLTLSRALTQVQKTAFSSWQRKMELVRRQQEYNHVMRNLGKRKMRSRVGSCGSSSVVGSSKRIRTGPKSEAEHIELLQKTKQGTIKLWKPLEYDSLLKSLSTGFHSNTCLDSMPQIIIYTPQWDRLQGKWLRTKFDLSWNGQDTSGYEHVAKAADTTSMMVTSLVENGNYKSTFGILFECGIDANHVTAGEIQAFDELLAYVGAQSWYKLAVVVVYWGVEVDSQITELLYRDELAFFTICRPSDKESQNLESQMDELCRHFNASLSDLGQSEASRRQQQRRERLQHMQEMSLAAQRHQNMLKERKKQEELDRRLGHLVRKSSRTSLQGGSPDVSMLSDVSMSSQCQPKSALDPVNKGVRDLKSLIARAQEVRMAR
jgi:hypothetical protein